MSHAVAPTSREFLSRLGITERCLVDDLDADADADLLELADRHVIVQKFIELRGLDQAEQERIQAVDGPAPVFSLHAGRARGGTVADTEQHVIWLLAARTHRGGDRSDAYEHIKRLHTRGTLFPTADDYERLLRRRNVEVVPALLGRVSALLARARERPGEVHTAVLPRSLVLSLCCQDVDDGMERLWMAVDPRLLEPRLLPLLQAALTPGDQHEPWQFTRDFPERGPDRRELRFTCLHGAPA